jgi:hypothetical protein
MCAVANSRSVTVSSRSEARTCRSWPPRRSIWSRRPPATPSSPWRSGLYTYVNPVPTVTGAPNLVKLLTQDCPQVTGGLLSVETDYVKAVDGMLAHIEAKRKKLGI